MQSAVSPSGYGVSGRCSADATYLRPPDCSAHFLTLRCRTDYSRHSEPYAVGRPNHRHGQLTYEINVLCSVQIGTEKPSFVFRLNGLCLERLETRDFLASDFYETVAQNLTAIGSAQHSHRPSNVREFALTSEGEPTTAALSVTCGTLKTTNTRNNGKKARCVLLIIGKCKCSGTDFETKSQHSRN